MTLKPTIPKGTRDFSPETMGKRNYIINTIKSVFEKYAYRPIETPAMEKLETLTGKYGEEGDRLIFKILNSGNYLTGIDIRQLASHSPQFITNQISGKALRYDLTIPFARYVVQHRNEIIFPFRRYQIQPVWRADRPQKGRFREFYQCDVDVIGSTSLWLEVELLQIYDEVFTTLNIPAIVKVNHRKILAGLAEFLNAKEQFPDIVIALDKLEKIGKEKVLTELSEKGLNKNALQKLEDFIKFSEVKEDVLSKMKTFLAKSDTALKGINELEFILQKVENLGLTKTKIAFEATLARGLDYYTGTIFEAKVLNYQLGSVGGGGRYDDLTGIFGLNDISGTGISFGLDRIYLVMEALKLFPDIEMAKTQILFVNFGENEADYCMKLIKDLREKEVVAELYPDAAKLKKQMSYADKKQIPFVVLIGDEEIKKQQITLKNMQTGEQKIISPQQLVKLI